VVSSTLVQSRLATYPAFIALSERPEFQNIATDVALQEFLIKAPDHRGDLRQRQAEQIPDGVADCGTRLGGGGV
jgi:hypothetical protein